MNTIFIKGILIMANLNPLNPQAHPAENGNAPNQNPNPHQHPAPAGAQRAANNQNQPADIVEAPIAKRKASKAAPKAKRQKIDAAAPAAEPNQVRKQKNPAPKKDSAAKRQKVSPKDQDIKSVLDIRHRLLQIKKNRAITPKKLKDLKPGVNDETKLRQFINGIISREKTVHNAEKRPLQGNPVLAIFALKILKDPKDPDYINAFLYLILKHPEKADEAAQELQKFLDSPDEALRTRQEEVRFALMKASLKRSQRYLSPIYPQERLSPFCEKAVIPSLLRIVEQDDLDHPLYDQLVRYMFQYWNRQFSQFRQKHGTDNKTSEEISAYNNNLDTSDWLFPLDLLEKTRRMIEELVTDIGSLKHGLALEIIFAYARFMYTMPPITSNYSDIPHLELMTKFFSVSKNLAMTAIEHAIQLLKDRPDLTKAEYNLLPRLYTITTYLHPTSQVRKSVKDILVKYCENLTQKVLENKDNILNQSQLCQKNRLYDQYKQSLSLILQESNLHMVVYLREFLKITQIDKNDFLMAYLMRNTGICGSGTDPAAFEFASIYWENIISKWSLTDFQNFFQQIKTVISLKNNSLRAQYIILDTIFLYGSDEVRLTFKEELKQYCTTPKSRNFVFSEVGGATTDTQQRFANALTRLYHLGILTNGDVYHLKQYTKNLNQAVSFTLPAVFGGAPQPHPAPQQRVAHPPVPQAAPVAQPAPQQPEPPQHPALMLLNHRYTYMPRVEQSNKSNQIHDIKVNLQHLRNSFGALYQTSDKAKWPPAIRENYKSLKKGIATQAKEILPLMNPYCSKLRQLFDAKAPDFKEKLLSELMAMRDARNNHDHDGKEHDEIIQTLAFLIENSDDEDIKTYAQLTKLDFKDPLDVSGDRLSLLETQIQTLMSDWDDYSATLKEAIPESLRHILNYIIDYMALITSGSEMNKDIVDFIRIKLYPALSSALGESSPPLKLLQSYITLLTAQNAKPASVGALFADIYKTLIQTNFARGIPGYIHFITYAVLLAKQNANTRQHYKQTFDQNVLRQINNCWENIPWYIQLGIVSSRMLMQDSITNFNNPVYRFVFKLYHPYLRRKETPQKLLTLPIKLRLETANLWKKPNNTEYQRRIAVRLAQLYDQFPLSYKRIYTQNLFMFTTSETKEKMVQFMLDEFKKPESAQMIEKILTAVAPGYYLTLLHRFFDRLVESDFKESPVQLNVLREAAKVTIPTVPFEAHEIPQHFQELFDALNMTDASKPDFISMPVILGLNDTEFNRSTYRNITRDQMRAKCMRFLKDLINRNLPAERQLALSSDEGAQKVWLPDPAQDAEWMQMISIMITKIKETENPDQRIYNTAILINGLFVCPTGQASALETAYASIVLKKELSSKSFKETMLYLIQESQEAALLKAISMPDSIVGQALGNNVHNEQIYRLILKATYGLRQISSFEETIARITTWADIEKVLRFFKQQWTEEMIISSILKSFATKEDCELALPGKANQADTLNAIRQAQKERPLKIFDSQGHSYYDWLMQNNLDPEEYGITLAKDETGEIDLYNFKIEKIEITKEILVKVLRQMGYWTAG